jgi:DNA polymerase
MTAEAVLSEIANQCASCELCDLHHSRKNALAGEGPSEADILIVGEAPGFHENEKGLPFVAASGKLLDELLQSIHINREDVFITNIVKCRPPSNRDPKPEELLACRPYLERQIEAINPKVIVTFGPNASENFIPGAKVSQIHGKPIGLDNRVIVPLYHPAAALHQSSLKSVLEADFTTLPGIITRANEILVNPPAEPVQKDYPHQLSLF